jgi:pimeloyl-ACP methyl ester carboxylesterase
MERLRGDYRTIAIDQRGHGQSSQGTEDFSRGAFVEDAAELLTALGVAPAVVVGQSMGGVNAIVLAATHPELVRALVLVEADARMAPGITDSIARWMGSWPLPFASRGDAIAFFGGDNLYGRTWADILVPSGDGLRPLFRPEDMLASVADMETTDWSEEWASIRCPTLLVAGSEGLARRDEMKRMGDAPHCEYIEIPGAGHDLHLEMADEWHRVLSDFLAKLEFGDIGRAPLVAHPL